MSSSFMGLFVQREALNIAQKALDITGNNISNIHTSGYTRQQVDIVSIANSKGTLGYNTSIALAGQGSEAVGVAQIRDRMLDKRVREYSGDLCCIGVKANTLSDVEDVFDSIESDDNNADVNRGASLAYFVSNFKSALQSFSADHADRNELANVAVNAAQSVVQCVVTYNRQLDDIDARTLEDADKTVDKINDILAQMGNLNKEIKASYVQMGYLTPTIMNYEVMNKYGPLELKDTMNSLLDELGQYGNIAFKEEADGTFTVDFAGQRVVEEKYYAQMAITTTNPAPTELEYEITTTLLDKDDWYDLHVKYGTGGDAQELVKMVDDGANPVTELETFNFSGVDAQGVQYLDSGALRGYLDMYNGRGIYAHEEKYTTDSINNTQPLIDQVNNILRMAAGSTPIAALSGRYAAADTDEEKAAILAEANAIINSIGTPGADNDQIKTLKDLIGADITDNGDGTITVELDRNVLDGTQCIRDNGDGTCSLIASADRLRYLTGAEMTGAGAAGVSVTLNGTALSANDEILLNDTGAYIKGAVVTVGGDAADDSALIAEANGIIKTINTPASTAEAEAERVEKIWSLEQLINATVTENADGTLTVTLDGNTLDGSETIQMDSDGNYYLGKKVDLDGVAGEKFVDISNSQKGVEYYRDMLNAFVRTATKEFNGIFNGIQDRDGNDIELFTYENKSGDTEFRTAAENFRVADCWKNNPEVIANPTGNNIFTELDNTYINKMIAVFEVELEYGDGVVSDPQKYGWEKYVQHICDDLGSEVSSAQSLYDSTDVALTGQETARSEVMDVSLNEEGINMINYQKWYNAISRMVTTLDEALEKLINGTGVVGLR